jgi:hypothetical protein
MKVTLSAVSCDDKTHEQTIQWSDGMKTRTEVFCGTREQVAAAVAERVKELEKAR